jgi:hypothetical protein
MAKDPLKTAEDVLEALIKAMTRPILGAGRPHRPARLLLDDAELVEALAPHLNELEIRCEYRYTLPLMNNALLEQARTHPGPAQDSRRHAPSGWWAA